MLIKKIFYRRSFTSSNIAAEQVNSAIWDITGAATGRPWESSTIPDVLPKRYCLTLTYSSTSRWVETHGDTKQPVTGPPVESINRFSEYNFVWLFRVTVRLDSPWHTLLHRVHLPTQRRPSCSENSLPQTYSGVVVKIGKINILVIWDWWAEGNKNQKPPLRISSERTGNKLKWKERVWETESIETNSIE